MCTLARSCFCAAALHAAAPCDEPRFAEPRGDLEALAPRPSRIVAVVDDGGDVDAADQGVR